MAHETPKNWHIKQNYIIYELVYFNRIIKRTHELQGSDTFACLIWNHVEAKIMLCTVCVYYFNKVKFDVDEHVQT